jgi:hypothetical protein
LAAAVPDGGAGVPLRAVVYALLGVALAGGAFFNIEERMLGWRSPPEAG